MPAYSLTQIAASYDRPIETTRRQIKQLIKDKRFEKRSPGKFFNERELSQLQILMDFTFRPMD